MLYGWCVAGFYGRARVYVCVVAWLRSETASLVTRSKRLETKWWVSPYRVEMSAEFKLDILIPEEELRQFWGVFAKIFFLTVRILRCCKTKHLGVIIHECCNPLYVVFSWYLSEITYTVLLLDRTCRTQLYYVQAHVQ